jgi:hypothetical protein
MVIFGKCQQCHLVYAHYFFPSPSIHLHIFSSLDDSEYICHSLDLECPLWFNHKKSFSMHWYHLTQKQKKQTKPNKKPVTIVKWNNDSWQCQK